MQHHVRSILIVQILCCLVTLAGGSYSELHAGDVSLTWDANTESDLAGYRVYYGTASRTYGVPILIGKQTTYTVTGLNAGTYYFAVTAHDTSGNESGQSNEISRTVTSSPPADTTPPVISGVTATNISQQSAVISWTTNELSDTQIEYGLTTAFGSATSVMTTLATTHSQTLANLSSQSTYYYRVKSRDAAGNLALSGTFTFTTLSSAPADTTPPVISGVTATNISQQMAVINWTTDEPSDIQVEYGTTTAYGNILTDATTLVTAHTQALINLVPGTVYNYRVKSRDAAGNLAVSGNFTFTTLGSALPAPTNVTVK